MLIVGRLRGGWTAPAVAAFRSIRRRSASGATVTPPRARQACETVPRASWAARPGSVQQPRGDHGVSRAAPVRAGDRAASGPSGLNGYSVFRSSCIVSCGSEVVGAFGGREDVDE